MSIFNQKSHPRLGGMAAVVAAAIWTLQWLHSGVTHGRTEHNEKQLYLGSTWMDSGGFLAVAFLLLVPGIMQVAMRAAPRARWARQLGLAASALLMLAALGTVLQFWLFEWGSYEESFESAGPLVHWGGLLQAFSSSLLLTPVLAALGVQAVRARVAPWWLFAVLCVGSLASFFLAGPLPPVPGVAWLVLGIWLLRRRDPVVSASPQRP